MLNPLRDSDLLALGAQTAGAVSLYECRAGGLTYERIRWLVETGRWQAPLPRVYITFSGPPPLETMQHAALQYAGVGATLSHESAGALWRLCRTPPAIHLTVPYIREVDAQPGLVLHRSRTLNASALHPALLPTRTTIERTVMDLLATKRNADTALGLVADAVRSRHTTPDRLRDVFRVLPKTRWRSVILDALPDINAGAHSPLELRDAAMRRRHGLPLGARQAHRTAEGSEYLDVVIEEFGVHIELDGRLGHDAAREKWRDMRRDNASEVAGMRHLRYGWADMVDRPCEVAAQQAHVLMQQGWPGSLRRCRDCPQPEFVKR
ncbi:MAG TPA: hypothetical protein VHW74_10505 [Mycobacteriales bacterium]|jgi:hypothetical protein|nr:hypothetical protein [Mycobacteriales bacterium]